ncbi:MAG: hypothetical protein JJT89_15035 [Nitriliruptoraceae bacterium]|nr:hypothetical protein [Nitriliruptoraceae bacterium]
MTDPKPTSGATTDHAPNGAVDLTAEIDLTPSPRPPVDLHDPSQRREVETTLGQIPGVLGARLVPGFDRPIDELHVLTTLDRAPKPTVRDVQTVLMARFGVPSDHRVISVVQLDEVDGIGGPTRRPLIATVGVTRTGDTVSARVALQDDDERVEGEAAGAATAHGRRRAVANAALNAVAPLLGEGVEVALDGVEVLEIAGRPVVVAVVELRAGRASVTLSGSALVDDVTDDATARAVLDAVNRSIGAPLI